MGAALGSCVCRKGESTDTYLHLPRVLGAVSALVCTSSPCRLEKLDGRADVISQKGLALRQGQTGDLRKTRDWPTRNHAAEQGRERTWGMVHAGDKAGAWGAPRPHPHGGIVSLRFSQIRPWSALTGWLILDNVVI